MRKVFNRIADMKHFLVTNVRNILSDGNTDNDSYVVFGKKKFQTFQWLSETLKEN